MQAYSHVAHRMSHIAHVNALKSQDVKLILRKIIKTVAIRCQKLLKLWPPDVIF